jgi:hypothetical protein
VFDYGPAELVFEVRGLVTGGEGDEKGVRWAIWYGRRLRCLMARIPRVQGREKRTGDGREADVVDGGHMKNF